MGKLVLTICTLVLSASAFAATSTPQIASSIKNAMQNHTSADQTSTLIYGGKDISRLATANESVWAGQDSVIG